MVSRRDLLRFTVLTSGALFAASIALAVLGRVDDRRRGNPKAIARVSDVPPGKAFAFSYPGSGDQAMLLNLPGQGFVAYSRKCTHLSCGVRYEPDKSRLHCPCHEGVFDPATGNPTSGPPQRPLPRIVLEQRGDTIWAMEEVP